MATTDEIRPFEAISADYAYDPSPFCDEPEVVHDIKWILDNRLPQVDRTIILLYAETGSYRKLGERMGFGAMTMRREVMRIRERIMEEYAKLH